MKTSLLTIALFVTLLFWSSCKEKSTEPVDEPCVDNIVKLDLGKDTVDYVQRASRHPLIIKDSLFHSPLNLSLNDLEIDSVTNFVKIVTGFWLNSEIDFISHRGAICNDENELNYFLQFVKIFDERFYKLEPALEREFLKNYATITDWENESVFVAYLSHPEIRANLQEDDQITISMYFNQCKNALLVQCKDFTFSSILSGSRALSASISLTKIPKIKSSPSIIVTYEEERRR